MLQPAHFLAPVQIFEPRTYGSDLPGLRRNLKHLSELLPRTYEGKALQAFKACGFRPTPTQLLIAASRVRPPRARPWYEHSMLQIAHEYPKLPVTEYALMGLNMKEVIGQTFTPGESYISTGRSHQGKSGLWHMSPPNKDGYVVINGEAGTWGEWGGSGLPLDVRQVIDSKIFIPRYYGRAISVGIAARNILPGVPDAV